MHILTCVFVSTGLTNNSSASSNHSLFHELNPQLLARTAVFLNSFITVFAFAPVLAASIDCSSISGKTKTKTLNQSSAHLNHQRSERDPSSAGALIKDLLVAKERGRRRW
jgi:hypothetical protein